MGIALLAPLSARSALPDPSPAVDRLLAGTSTAALTRGDAVFARGTLSIRDASASVVSHGAEPVAAQALPTPASAPMEATIMPNAPVTVAEAVPQLAPVYAAGDT